MSFADARRKQPLVVLSRSPEYRTKEGLAELRKTKIMEMRRSRWEARLSGWFICLVASKVTNRWERSFLDLIMYLQQQNGSTIPLSQGVKVTAPITNRDAAASLGCSVGTILNCKARWKKDKVVSFTHLAGEIGDRYWFDEHQLEAAPDIEDADTGEQQANKSFPVGIQVGNFNSNEKEGLTKNDNTKYCALKERTKGENADEPQPPQPHPVVVPGQPSAPLPVESDDTEIRVETTAASTVSWWHHRDNGTLTIRVECCRCSERTKPLVREIEGNDIKAVESFFETVGVPEAEKSYLVNEILRPWGKRPVSFLLEFSRKHYLHKFKTAGFMAEVVVPKAIKAYDAGVFSGNSLRQQTDDIERPRRIELLRAALADLADKLSVSERKQLQASVDSADPSELAEARRSL